MVATPTMQRQLEARGFRNIVRWTRGVDVELFRPARQSVPGPAAADLRCMSGRVAVEKNIEAFLELDLPGTKLVIGDGPARERAQAKYPGGEIRRLQVRRRTGARIVAAADVFVFPSRTDTFGLVLLEAMACGVPVAAYPVTGPIDVVEHGVTGVLSEDLRRSRAGGAAAGSGGSAAAYALAHTWEAATRQFLAQSRAARRQESALKPRPAGGRALSGRGDLAPTITATLLAQPL